MTNLADLPVSTSPAATDLPKRTALARPKRRGPWLLLGLLVLIVASASAGFYWASKRSEAQFGAARAELELLIKRASAAAALADTRLTQTEDRMAALEAARVITESAQTQAIARVEGLSARVDSAISAVSRATQAQPSSLSLKLDDVQFLLSQAHIRLSLAGDGSSALKALKLARANLLGVSDPSYLGFVADIDAAISELVSARPLDRGALGAEIETAIIDADQLRLRGPARAAEATETWRSRLRATLDRYFVIEREGARAAARGLSEAELVSQIKAGLRLARLAALSADQATFNAALAGLSPLLLEFDAQLEARIQLAKQLARWQKTELNTRAPALGALVERFARLKTLDPSA